MRITKIGLVFMCVFILLMSFTAMGAQGVSAAPEGNPYGPGSGPGGGPTGYGSRAIPEEEIHIEDGECRGRTQPNQDDTGFDFNNWMDNYLDDMGHDMDDYQGDIDQHQPNLDEIRKDMMDKARDLPPARKRIRTPEAVIGPRGTDFYVKQEGNTTTLIVYEGVVEFTDIFEEWSVFVFAGEEVTATGIPEADSREGSEGRRKDYKEVNISAPKPYNPEKLEGLAAVKLSDEWAEADAVTLNNGDDLESERPTRAKTSTGSMEIMTSPGTKISYTEERPRMMADLYWKLGVALFLIASAAVVGVSYIRHRRQTVRNSTGI